MMMNSWDDEDGSENKHDPKDHRGIQHHPKPNASLPEPEYVSDPVAPEIENVSVVEDATVISRTPVGSTVPVIDSKSQIRHIPHRE